MATTYDRWFIVPADTVEETNPDGTVRNTYLRPRYADKGGLIGLSGNTVTPTVVNETHSNLVDQYPDIDPWYIVRLYGEGDTGKQSLDDISGYGETRDLSPDPSDVAAVHNNRPPGFDRRTEEWNKSYFIGI